MPVLPEAVYPLVRIGGEALLEPVRSPSEASKCRAPGHQKCAGASLTTALPVASSKKPTSPDAAVITTRTRPLTRVARPPAASISIRLAPGAVAGG